MGKADAAVQVFFNSPEKGGKDWPPARLWDDMQMATERLLVASAWFTDSDIADIIIRSRATIRIVIMNRSDVDRGKAAKRIAGDFEFAAEMDDPVLFISILGAQDFRKGVMHHKFVVADDIAWCGSSNLTYQSRSNYENLIRIESKDIADQFAREAILLADGAGLQSDQIPWAELGR